MRRRFVFAASVALASLTAGAAQAQIFTVEPPPRERAGSWSFDIVASLARPIGDFHTQVDHGWGLRASERHRFGWFAPVSLGGHFSFLNYYYYTKRSPTI